MIALYKDGARNQTILVCQQLLLVELVLLVNQSLRLFLNADMVLIASILNALFHILLQTEILEFQMLKAQLHGQTLFVNLDRLFKVLPTGPVLLEIRTLMLLTSSLVMLLPNNAQSLSLPLMEQQQQLINPQSADTIKMLIGIALGKQVMHPSLLSSPRSLPSGHSQTPTATLNHLE